MDPRPAGRALGQLVPPREPLPREVAGVLHERENRLPLVAGAADDLRGLAGLLQRGEQQRVRIPMIATTTRSSTSVNARRNRVTRMPHAPCAARPNAASASDSRVPSSPIRGARRSPAPAPARTGPARCCSPSGSSRCWRSAVPKDESRTQPAFSTTRSDGRMPGCASEIDQVVRRARRHAEEVEVHPAAARRFRERAGNVEQVVRPVARHAASAPADAFSELTVKVAVGSRVAEVPAVVTVLWMDRPDVLLARLAPLATETGTLTLPSAVLAATVSVPALTASAAADLVPGRLAVARECEVAGPLLDQVERTGGVAQGAAEDPVHGLVDGHGGIARGDAQAGDAGAGKRAERIRRLLLLKEITVPLGAVPASM